MLTLFPDRSSRTPAKGLPKERGIALLMVIFTITLLSILAIALTQSTYIGSQLHRSFVDRFRAELLSRSALNVALEIIAQDSGEVDPPKDSWGPFIPGQTVPATILGITDPRLEIGLEITAENSKIPLFRVKQTPGISGFAQWRDILARLFELSGCDADGEADHTGLFGDRIFSSKEMVGNLIDYLDEDSSSFSEGGYTGVEAELPEGYFPQKGVKSLTIQELVAVPGFTPNRLRKIEPYITPLAEVMTVNINLAAPLVLRAIDSNITENAAEAIAEFARGGEGPFSSQNQKGEYFLSANFPNYQNFMTSILTFKSTPLQIITKVQFGDRRFFARARVNREAGQPPSVIMTEFFG